MELLGLYYLDWVEVAGMSNHYLVRAALRVKGEWRNRQMKRNKKVLNKVSELVKKSLGWCTNRVDGRWIKLKV